MDSLTKEWKHIAESLNLQLQIPFQVHLKSGETVIAPLLLKNFGNVEGIVIVTKWSAIKAHISELSEMHYAVATWDASDRELVLSDIVDVLQDWGWWGDEVDRPHWMV